MGRFGDVWKSGKFSLNTKQQTPAEEGLSDEVVSMMQEISPEFGLTDASHVVLGALKSRRSLETGRWLSTLATEASATQPKLPQATTSSGSTTFDDMAAWVDQLFQQFRDLTFEFNKTAINSNLLVTLEQPETFEGPAAPGTFGRARVYRGRLTTSQWALAVLGREGKISIYLLPSALLLAFTAGQLNDRDYPPFIEVVKGNVNGRTGWTIGGQPAPPEAMPYLAKELLGDLIRVASGVMSENELFANTTEKPKLGENLAVGYTAPPQTPAPATAGSAKPAGSDSAISDACDLVDEAIERELKALYERASTLKPDSEQATPTRTKISNLEKFRSKMLAAFEEYTHVDQKTPN
ncbi:MAG: hypothetical protein C5B53_13355 [Candidatus Melainabacteria bacterium]|nr:MAG: hypothetical protein C5B53_13355 [Candidatus Melainabacteria bacterium]